MSRLANVVAGLMLTSLALGVVGSAPAQAASTPPAPWHQQALPGTGPDIDLTGISCSSATFCMAVGEDNLNHTAVAEKWNGKDWAPVPMKNPPSPSPSDYYGIHSVSCVSRTDCVAVGSVDGRIILHTLAEVWHGTRWRTTTAVPAGDEPVLSAVSCVSAKDCIAVGGYTIPGPDISHALAEQWNGTNWKRILHSPTVRSLTQVSCPSASLCFASGEAVDGIERWNGGRWTNLDHSTLAAPELSCASTRSCLALGCPNPSTCFRSGIQNSYAWNGSTWRRVTTNGAKRQNLLDALSCVSATSCTAVGGLKGATNAVAARWNGHDWTLQRDPGGVSGLSLGAVSCVPAACEALGELRPLHSYPPPTALRSN